MTVMEPVGHTVATRPDAVAEKVLQQQREPELLVAVQEQRPIPWVADGHTHSSACYWDLRVCRWQCAGT
jgi:hypothetical protein